MEDRKLIVLPNESRTQRFVVDVATIEDRNRLVDTGEPVVFERRYIPLSVEI